MTGEVSRDPELEFPLPRTFLDHVLVQCPRCKYRATVHGRRLTCGACGYIGEAPRDAPGRSWWTVRQDGIEPTFEVPLWLTTECCGRHLLWALNEPHLDYLERFVASTQRDRDFPSPSGNRGLSNKLPTWMKLARNRDEILHAMQRLRERAA